MRLNSRKTGVIMAGLLLLLPLAWATNRMSPESAPIARGAAFAQIRGCVNCHGDPENLLLDSSGANCSNVNDKPSHPSYDIECTDLMAYFEAVRLRRNFNSRLQGSVGNPLAAGEQLAREYHCFQCHGYLGQGGFKNENSFKGYVPGYFGNDFKLLTRNGDPESVRAWIVNGMDDAMLEKPISGAIAEFYFTRQAVGMPKFGSLPADEIEILVNYVIAINSFGPMTAEAVRSYAKQTRSMQMLATCKGISAPDC